MPPPYPSPEPASRGTATSSRAFVETVEYSRFVDFCEACRHFRVIGLCLRTSGIGKILSAYAIAARTRSFRAVVGQATRAMTCLLTRCSIQHR
jgi:hypothetical protein